MDLLVAIDEANKFWALGQPITFFAGEEGNIFWLDSIELGGTKAFTNISLCICICSFYLYIYFSCCRKRRENILIGLDSVEVQRSYYQHQYRHLCSHLYLYLYLLIVFVYPFQLMHEKTGTHFDLIGFSCGATQPLPTTNMACCMGIAQCAVLLEIVHCVVHMSSARIF